ncbi:ATP-binding protein [Candidatus Woesearchaeota archaeon]|nr:ATP-binding protein [Candidatus Woesearchaeota archaeon]
MYEIVVGRSDDDRKSLGIQGAVFLGKHYVRMGNTTSLSNKIYLDVAKTHVVLVSGKRGSGKSYSLGVVAEEMAHLPKEVKNKIAVLMIDTMGIFWTMRFPNLKDEDLLDEWGLPKKPLDINIYVPAGQFNEYKNKGIPADFSFTINPAELSALDWCNSFEISITEKIGVAIESTISIIKEEKQTYSIDNIIKAIENNKNIDTNIKLATINRFIAAKSWGIFSETSTPLREIVSGGKVSVLDISAYKDWNVKNLVTGIICKKLMEERVIARKKEEMEDVRRGHSYFQTTIETTGEELPLVWILIDEAHSFLPKDKTTAATDALVTILREGRQPGISLILATQQPGEIHSDVITQTDVVLSHRITAKRDIEALNSMMQSYLPSAIQKYFNILPKMRGSAIILDDNSERIFPLQVRPRFTWHGGEAPTALKQKGKAAAELGL